MLEIMDTAGTEQFSKIFPLDERAMGANHHAHQFKNTTN